MSLSFLTFFENWGPQEQCKWYFISRALDTPWIIAALKAEPLSLWRFSGSPNLGIISWIKIFIMTYLACSLLLLLLLSRFSRVRLCATPLMAAHWASPFLGFSKQEHWSGLPFPSRMHESEKWKCCNFLIQGIFPTQESNPGLLHCRQILYWLSYEGVKVKMKVIQLWPTVCDPMD